MLSDVIVATDDQRIIDAVESFGGKVMMTKDSHPSGTDRCGEIASHFDDIDVVINIQGDEPLVDYRQLDALIAVFMNWFHSPPDSIARKARTNLPACGPSVAEQENIKHHCNEQNML
jgi:CMP-2-keto-3-deoxyoctulosonic acid synthetase